MPLGITGSVQQDDFGLVYSCARSIICYLSFSEETLSVILYIWDLDSFSTTCIHRAKKHGICDYLLLILKKTNFLILCIMKCIKTFFSVKTKILKCTVYLNAALSLFHEERK